MNIGPALKKWSTTAALLCLLPAAGAAAQDRPLPDVARQKAGKTAARVLTNEDLEKTPPTEDSPPPSRLASSHAAPRPESREAGHIAVPGLLQEASPAEARAILKSLQHDQEVLLRRYAEIEHKLAGETDEHLRQLYSSSLLRRDETLARKRQQIEEVKKAIEAAEKNVAASPESKHEKPTGTRK
jgi:hypothetical protein